MTFRGINVVTRVAWGSPTRVQVLGPLRLCTTRRCCLRQVLDARNVNTVLLTAKASVSTSVICDYGRPAGAYLPPSPTGELLWLDHCGSVNIITTSGSKRTASPLLDGPTRD
jgi:hypothetical protein